MARKHYWQFLVTDEGNPIENAQISIYTAGTENAVYVYTDEIGAGFSQTAPQTVTSRKGYFEFWIADENEANGYPLSTKFKIAWSAAGVSDGFIDYVDVFSTSWAPVDETDVNVLKNKAVSNFLAKGWEDHKDSTLPLDSPHDLGAVNEFDTNGDRKKVMSNYQGLIWDNHTKNSWDLTLNGDGQYIADGTNPITRMHGIEQVDETVTGTDKNRLVSNTLAKSWTDHVADTITDVHPQYPMANATGTQFTGKITGVSTVNADPANTLVTKSYVDGKGYTETILASGWNIDVSIISSVGTGYADDTALPTTGGTGTGMTVDIITYAGAVQVVTIVNSGSGYVVGDEITINAYGGNATFILGDITYDVVHNLSENYPLIQLWEIDGATHELVVPTRVTNSDTTTIRVFVDTNIDHFVRVNV